VFDTNILISARLSIRGTPAHCLGLARAGLVESLTCEGILREFQDKLEGKFGRLPSAARFAAEEIRAISRVVTITDALQVISADPDDNMVTECAVVGGATHIVTGDKRPPAAARTVRRDRERQPRRVPRLGDTTIAVNNSRGFGRHNAALAFKCFAA
jgi:putative PIN family toxin of toxin-antitoxin system